MQQRRYNAKYEGENLNRVAFPLGGIGAGMVCLEGSGALSHVSLFNQPDVHNEPQMFSALYVKGAAEDGGDIARVLEGVVPDWKIMSVGGPGGGGGSRTYGLPRFGQTSFSSRFPFGTVSLCDEALPVAVEITGWSPFTPPEPDDSSLPVAALEFYFVNKTDRPIEAIYSFNAKNFMGTDEKNPPVVKAADGGFEFYQPADDKEPWKEGSFCAAVDDAAAKVNCAWFRGGSFDSLTMVWKSVAAGEIVEQQPVTESKPSPGGSIFVPFTLPPNGEKTIKLQLGWYVPKSNVSAGHAPPADCCSGKCSDAASPTHQPWYSSKFASVDEVMNYWQENFGRLRLASETFADCFYDTTLPAEVVEAVAANLTILKSPTCLRQADGRFWAWEGCDGSAGSCHGTCTHVWNYAQALPHLFPSLERTIRETEYNECLSDNGFQAFRARLPISGLTDPPTDGAEKVPAADGQLGSIMRVYREWRICGDTAWAGELWPMVRRSLDYCIETWDPERVGAVVEPHHNTYDIEFWGPDGLCTSMYLGALRAAIEIGLAIGDDVSEYEQLAEKSLAYLETELFDGEYFIQKVMWKGLRAGDPTEAVGLHPKMYESLESKALLQKEGPKYQYGKGCLSDGVLGAWIADVCGLGEILDRDKIESHLLAVHKHNFRGDLSSHANPQRPTYALGSEAGLLLCSWPKGGSLSLPFIYSNEVWTGIEYQVAAHLMTLGHVEEGLEIVRACRDRYDGRVRNPFNEYECGYWYARAMASYGMLQGLTGVRYDAVEKVLYVSPQVRGDFRAFLSTATGFGTVGMRAGQAFLDVKSGMIEVNRIQLTG